MDPDKVNVPEPVFVKESEYPPVFCIAPEKVVELLSPPTLNVLEALRLVTVPEPDNDLIVSL